MFQQIDYHTAIDFILPLHYAGRKPNVKYAFGDFNNETNKLEAVITYGIPASPPLCKGVAGVKNKDKVLELNRMIRLEDYNKPLSQFVAWTLNQLKHLNLFIVSYSDTAMNHHGYVYQACNFLYTGCTKGRTDKYTENGKHCRHYDNDKQNGLRIVRSPKHRYIYLCAENKRIKKQMLKDLKYPIIKEYPKGNQEHYILGEFLKPKIVRKENYDKVI